jgi:hypothetical protein
VQLDTKAFPVLLLVWPAGQSRQEVEAAEGWYLEAGQEVHNLSAASTLDPADVAPPDEPVDGPPAAFEHMSISFLDCPLGQRLVVPVQDSAEKPTSSLQQFTPPEYA